VVIFSEPKFRGFRVPGTNVVVWGAGHDGPDLRQNLLDGLRLPSDGVHVLLFHGSDLANVPEGKRAHCGFRPVEIARAGAAFALLGHYHGARVKERCAYPGSPEPLDFSEAGQHYVLRLDVDENAVHPELIPFGTVRYETRTLDVTPMSSSEELRDDIVAAGDAGAIVRVVLEGELNAGLDLDIGAIYNACAEGFAFLDLVDRTRPAWQFDEIAEESTTRGAFVRLLQSKVDAAGDDAETARLALRLGMQAFERREVRVP
jgi:DNA repair exonuclease SbcCD nuclease subunit